MTIIDLFRYAQQTGFVSVEFAYDAERNTFYLMLDSTEPPYTQEQCVLENCKMEDLNEVFLEAYTKIKEMEAAIHEC